jgi:osmoprotectant transport system substrate-binding protein
MHLMKKIISLTLIISLLGILTTGCGSKKDVIKIGHKNYTEARVLGQMFRILIEKNTDYETDIKEFGGTSICLEALKNEEIDMFPEYTGTAYTAILGQSELTDPKAVYDYVKEAYQKEFNILWLNELGYNNTYTFAVNKETAEKYNLKTFTDLQKASNELVLGATMEFIEREDGLPGIEEVYNIKFKDVKGMDPGLRYTAINDRKIDVMDAFSTDGKLLALNLSILEDDKQFFPPYYVAPILHQNFADKHPEIVDLLNKLGNQVTEEEMQKLNNQVDSDGLPEEKVVEDFLRSKGLIK